MTSAMLLILAVWAVALFLGPPIWLTMALAGTIFVLSQHVDSVIIVQQEVSAANSFTFVAAPLFILMGHVMNNAGVTQRIFEFALVGRGLGARRSLSRERDGIDDLRRHVGFRRRRSGRAGHGRDSRHAGRQISDGHGRGPHGRSRDDRPDHSAVAADGGLRCRRGSVGRQAVHSRCHPWRADGSRPHGSCSFMARRLDLPGKFPTAAVLWRKFRDAFWALMTPVVLLAGMLWSLHANRSGGRCHVYALILGLFVYR